NDADESHEGTSVGHWEGDTLVIARRVVAPDVLRAPSDTTLVYVRDTDHVFHEASHCVSDDRSVDHTTGRQKFDLTPPADLPPPPPH
ncbi:MAG TPA: hypothetical protein VFO94_18055, partial [Gammaproteobacteria bacterium]|nr:hypothetical protein [Gammaproteobacteria bacterium]